ncbi:MAG: UvrD-helicase domain-containing protein [Acidobacteriota bacterium]
MTTIDFAKTLNEGQYAAVTHEGPPQLVIAGAGSGKTRVITYRIAWLVQERGVDPSAIAAVTFTNKAAAEMKGRVEELLGLYPLRAFIGTFHRFSLRLLRMYGQRVQLPKDFSILDTSDQMTLVKRAMKSAGVPDDSFRPRAVLSAISSAKNQLMGPARYEREADDFFTRKVAAVYQHYQALLREAGGVDFDDMIRLSVQLMRTQPTIAQRVRGRLQYLMVDEFQDTNTAQMALIEELIGTRGHLTAVGDEDQGIYRWRGAELANILEFEESFSGAEVRKLEQNYRSTQKILDASGALVAHNEKRRGKVLWTEAGDGEQILVFRARDEKDEARWIVNALEGLTDELSYGQMAILVRTNAQTRALEEEMIKRGTPYNLVAGVRFFERAEIKDLVAYLRLIRQPEDRLSFERVLNRPARGIGKQTSERLYELSTKKGMTPWALLASGLSLDPISSRGKKALQRFHDLIVEMQRLSENLPIPAVLRQIVESTGYVAQYDKNDPDDVARIENIDELLSSAQDFVEQNAYASESDDLLSAFLDHVALVSDTDGLGRGGVSVMTLHSAKGLEFKAVVLAGLEEGLLPHFNAKSDPDDLEEERRLLYVGMTRAEERLMLTVCRRRRMAGTYQDQDESRFLAEIPGRFLAVEHSSELFESPQRGYGYGSNRDSGGGRYGSAPRYGSGATWTTAGGSGPSRSSSSTSGGDKDRRVDDVYSFFGKAAPAGASSASGSTSATGGGTSGGAASKPPSAPAPMRLPFEPETPKGGAIKRGARVRHAKLGVGKIMHIEGSGANARLVIYFEGVGRRKLVAKYANLDVL